MILFFKKILSSADFWKFTVPLIGATIAWFVNEWRKRIWEQYQRKEESYKELLRCIDGFYVGADNAAELKTEFLNQLTRCWLYCPDAVLKNRYAFLNTINSKAQCTDKQKDDAMGKFVASIREDLLSRKLVKSTKLTESDFKHFKAN